MRTYILGAVIAIGLVYGSIIQAGTLGPSLQQTLSSQHFEGEVPVIIRFADRLDLKALRQEVVRSLKQRYQSPKQRKTARKRLKRAMLVKGLKQRAQRSERLVQMFLASRGERRKLGSLWAINGVYGDVPAHLVEDLANLPGVEQVELDVKFQATGTGTAPASPIFWNLEQTGVSVLWNDGHTGAGVVVATLDTGVDATHPDLGPRFRGGAYDWFDPYGQHPVPADVNGHGTQVLGLILAGDAGGYQIGMAPDAQWIAAKIFDDADEATLSGIHAAFQWVLDPDGDPATDDTPDIVNNSWDLANTVNQCVQEFALDIALLKEAEIAVAFAGGNYGPDLNTSVSPANDPAVLSVGAVDYYANVDVLSGRGVNACDGGVYPSLTAPGDGVLTTDLMPGFYNVVGGTSFAVAHLSGGLALLKSAFPDASVSQLEASLIDTAVDLGAGGPDNDYGYGLMDVAGAYIALEAAIGGGNPGSLEFGSIDYSVDEKVPSLMVTVTRSGGTSGEVSVDYATADGLAGAGADYESTSGTLTFLDGEASQTFSVSILDDQLMEGDEDFSLLLSNPLGGAELGLKQSAMVTILDDDQPLDSDGDGVSDPVDLCPGTPAGEPVDGSGCAASQLDGDGDGVSDALDQCPGTPPGESVDAVGCPLGPQDLDGDDYTSDQDCNDNDASIYPGAPEIKHDGVDQDCNGYDLTIDIDWASYQDNRQRIAVLATSALNAEADLQVIYHGAAGESLTRYLNWNANKSRWQRVMSDFYDKFGFIPVSVTVFGPEGQETATVQ